MNALTAAGQGVVQQLERDLQAANERAVRPNIRTPHSNTRGMHHGRIVPRNSNAEALFCFDFPHVSVGA